jgi:hypothetical protein
MKELRAVKVAFLPPNTTTKLQPLDQGVLKKFKTSLPQQNGSENVRQN